MTETTATADERTPGGAILMDGARLRDEITERMAAEMLALGSPRVCLGTVLVGDDRPSQIYVRSKHRQAEKAGMTSQHIGLPPTASQAEVEDAVAGMAADPDVHGILVQLPLAPPADAQAVLEEIPPLKDVDGLHPLNVGRLSLGLPGLVPATPRGILELLRFYDVPLKGRHAVVLGRSNIVGRPLATLLSRKEVDMTVTIGHSASGPRLIELAREADLLVAAIGRPEMITADWVKPGATVVDVGIHRLPATGDGTQSRGRLTGDVHAESVSKVAGALTPVPGGVGPLTVAMVIVNTLWAATQQASVKV